MIEFECPACEATIRVGENAVGKKGRCPKCQTLLLVPDPDDFEDEDVEEEEETDVETASEPAPEAVAVAEAPAAQQPDLESVREPEPGPAPIPESESEPVSSINVDEPTAPVVSPTTATSESEPATEPVQEPVPDPMRAEESQPAPAFTPDPDNPFAFASPPSAVSRATSRRYSQRRRPSSRTTRSIVAALSGVLILIIGSGLLYLLIRPDLSGELPGERFKRVDLPSVTIAGPSGDVPADDVSAVFNVLKNEGLPLTSEYIRVSIDAVDSRPRVTVACGSQAIPVRVALGDHPGIRAVLASEREHIAKVKQQELKTATDSLFRDYAAYLEDGTTMPKLPAYRNQVALNASIGPVGYAIEAVVSGYPFPSVYEDADGHCYYFLPEGVRTFQLRGRRLPDGSTPLPVEIQVTLTDAASPVVTKTKSDTDKDDAEPEPESDKKDADNNEDESSKEPKAESEQEPAKPDAPAEMPAEG